MHSVAGRQTLAAVVAGLAAEEVDVVSQDPDGLVQDDIAVGELAGNWQVIHPGHPNSDPRTASPDRSRAGGRRGKLNGDHDWRNSNGKSHLKLTILSEVSRALSMPKDLRQQCFLG
jgi:hypothetical protein